MKQFFQFLKQALTGIQNQSQMINGFRVKIINMQEANPFRSIWYLRILKFQYPNFSVLNSSLGLKKDFACWIA